MKPLIRWFGEERKGTGKERQDGNAAYAYSIWVLSRHDRKLIVSYVLLDMMASNWVKRLSTEQHTTSQITTFWWVRTLDWGWQFYSSCANTSVLRSRSFFHAIVSLALRRCCAKRGKIVNDISIVANVVFLVKVYYHYHHECLNFVRLQ